MYERFTDRARKVMQLANQEAQRFNHEYIATEHVLLGLVKEGSGVAASVLANLNVDLRKVRLEIEKLVQAGPHLITVGKLPQTPRTKTLIQFAMEESRQIEHTYVGTEHLLLGLLREQEGIAAQVLSKLGVTFDKAKAELLAVLGTGDVESSRDPSKQPESPYEKSRSGKSKTPAIDKCCRDLTNLAHDGKLKPVIGRQKELQRITIVLGRCEGNSPLLIGQPGIGRTALIHGLANQLVRGDFLSDRLENKRIVELDHGALIAGSKYRGDLEERARAIVHEMKRTKNVILYLPDLRELIENKGDVGVPLFGIFRRAMFHREIQCISIATPHAYQELVKQDNSLERLFQRVVVPPTTRSETYEILRGLRHEYEQYHGVQIIDSAIEAAVKLSEQFFPNHALPGSAISLLDEAASRTKTHSMLVRPNTDDVDQQIETLNQAFETAVANQDFEQAASLRDQRVKLIQERDEIFQAWRQSESHERIVDDLAVQETVNELVDTGRIETDDRTNDDTHS